MIKHMSDVIVLNGDDGETLASLFQKFTTISLRSGEIVYEQSADNSAGLAIFIVLDGMFKVTIRNPKPSDLALRTVGAGAVFGHMPESGLMLEETEIAAASDGHLLALSYADWVYLKQKKFWRS